jgi:cytochrome c oxidase subunit 2
MRALLLLALAGLCLGLGAADNGWGEVDRLVELVNPARDIDTRLDSSFTGAPVSDIAREIKGGFWFSLAVFLPFLILPQILLLYIIIAFRDRGDGRKPATWISDHKLELFWTAVPILALVVVAVPMVKLLYHQEAPPKAAAGEARPMLVEVIGKQFAWLYNYPDFGIEGLTTYPVDLSAYGIDPARPIMLQEAVVFPRGRISNLTFSSLDVNHAWGVQAFGIRKDCIRDRQNWAWFKPEENGFFEGQCYELCGSDHGAMLLVAAVVDPEDFDRWVELQHFRAEALRVIRILVRNNQPPTAEAEPGTEEAARVDGQAALQTALAGYLADAATQREQRLFALRYWLAYDAAVKRELLRRNQLDDLAGQIEADGRILRQELDILIDRNRVAAETPAPGDQA